MFVLAGELSELHPYSGANCTGQVARLWNQLLQACLQRLHCTGETQLFSFNVHGSVHRKNILIYIQQDVTLHSLFYLEAALDVSGGTTTHHQERKQLYLQHLVFVTLLLLSAAIVEELELV